MANPEHLEILKRSVEEWNRWGESHTDITPDLSGAKLFGADLNLAYLSGANLSEASLIGAALRQADLIGADLIGADLKEAKLIEAMLIKANLIGANLYMASLRETDLRDVIGLTWEQVSEAIVDETTQLPPELEDRRKAEKGGKAAAPNQ